MKTLTSLWTTRAKAIQIQKQERAAGRHADICSRKDRLSSSGLSYADATELSCEEHTDYFSEQVLLTVES